MKLLALDTATERCSAALWLDGEIRERSTMTRTGHSSPSDRNSETFMRSPGDIVRSDRAMQPVEDTSNISASPSKSSSPTNSRRHSVATRRDLRNVFVCSTCPFPPIAHTCVVLAPHRGGDHELTQAILFDRTHRHELDTETRIVSPSHQGQIHRGGR